MKNVLVTLIILISLLGCNNESQNPSEFGQEFYKTLKSKKNYNFNKHYLTKNEFKKLMDDAIIFRQSDNQLMELYNGWTNDKIDFFSNFKNEINNNYKRVLTNSNLDSITYSYLKPMRGKDQLIKWPDSKNYQIDSKKLIIASISIYFSESNNGYRLIVNPMNFNKKWKFWKECKKPMLEKLN